MGIGKGRRHGLERRVQWPCQLLLPQCTSREWYQIARQNIRAPLFEKKDGIDLLAGTQNAALLCLKNSRLDLLAVSWNVLVLVCTVSYCIARTVFSWFGFVLCYDLAHQLYVRCLIWFRPFVKIWLTSCRWSAWFVNLLGMWTFVDHSGVEWIAPGKSNHQQFSTCDHVHISLYSFTFRLVHCAKTCQNGSILCHLDEASVGVSLKQVSSLLVLCIKLWLAIVRYNGIRPYGS